MEPPKTTPDPAAPTAPSPAPAEQTPADAAPPTTSGETPQAPPSPPKPAEPPTPPVNKMKKMIKIGLPILVVIIIVAIAAIYFFVIRKPGGSDSAQIPTEIVEASEDPEATESGQIAVTPCISGYKPYSNDLFSICIPKTMENVENGAESEEGNGKKYTFEDDVAVLTVLTDYKENLNKFNCSTSKVVKVSGFQAQRYLIKSEGKTPGSCASTISQYATLVSSGPEKPLYFIGLKKKEGAFQSDNGGFVSIDQSFFLNQ